MDSSALVIAVLLGLVEFAVINKALREWAGRGGLATWLLAAVVTAIPLIGGIASLVASIVVLGWPWWISMAVFIGGSGALALTGGKAALLGASLF